MERAQPAPLTGDTIHTAPFADLRPNELYGILRVRSVVFVVEQECVFLDLDGRDLEPTAVHCWIEDGAGTVLSCLRILDEAEGTSIGRVVTEPAARHRGLAGRLLDHALALAARPVAINAQARLEPWYAGFGFERSGPDFVEDGIVHVPMRLES